MGPRIFRENPATPGACGATSFSGKEAPALRYGALKTQ